jgi:diadenosine tetraphosphate (Ap4A) HIT family hydrolase
MSTLIHQRVEEARQGKNSTVICQVPSVWVVLGDVQFLRGYSLLLPDPVVESLNSLSGKQREVFLQDMTIIGDALLKVTDAFRINYEILGNKEPTLHAHIFPRYLNEPIEKRSRPVWFYERQNVTKFDLQRDRHLMEEIATLIQNSY